MYRKDIIASLARAAAKLSLATITPSARSARWGLMLVIATNDVDAISNYFADITLAERTLTKDGYWNTLCLPFDVTIANSPLAGDGVTISSTTPTEVESTDEKVKFVGKYSPFDITDGNINEILYVA